MAVTIDYSTPAYPCNLYGPTYKMWPVVKYALDASCDIDADFAHVGDQTDSDSSSLINYPYPFGLAGFAGSHWGSGIQMRLPGSQGCQIPCSCKCNTCGKR